MGVSQKIFINIPLFSDGKIMEAQGEEGLHLRPSIVSHFCAGYLCLANEGNQGSAPCIQRRGNTVPPTGYIAW